MLSLGAASITEPDTTTGPVAMDLRKTHQVAKVLVVAPHPDDESLGCGGSIAAHVAAGHRVAIAFLTSGERGSPTIAPHDLGPLREREATAAAAVLGVPAGLLRFLRLPDGDIQAGDVGQLEAAVRLLRLVRPVLLYMPHADEASFDHQRGFELCWRAAGLSGSANFPEWGPPHWVATILGYEVWSPIPQPAYLRSIDEFVEDKLAALGCYDSQRQKAKGDEQASHIGRAGLSLSAYRGASTIGGHREAFAVMRLGSVPL